MDGVDDDDDPKMATIQLLVAAASVGWAADEKAEVAAAKAARVVAKTEAARLTAEEQAEAKADAMTRLKLEKENELRAELAQLKLGELKKMAREQGVGADMVDAVDEADDPKAAATDLLVQAAAEWDEAEWAEPEAEPSA
eukprot:SAG22_NODE_9187_length_604_cov_1.211881_1_plen_140_part_00